MNKAGTVDLEQLQSGAVVIRLGSPEEKVVTLTTERMESLKSAVERVQKERSNGLIITGPSAHMFTAGADINAIRAITDPAVAEDLARMGQEVFALVEALPCITVAAVSGPCVGGGCELALACKYRIITKEPNSVIGLPETKLGILPGFGGSQRLPRLVGLTKALDIILAGKALRPEQAVSAGLVNEIVPTETLLSRAEKIANGSVQPRQPKMKLLDKLLTFTSFGRNFVRKNASAKVKQQTKGHYPAPPAALETVLFGLENGPAEGYKREARELGRLLVTPESKALVNIFFLTEESKGLGKSGKAATDHIHAVVVGAGVMGAGIAGMFAQHKCQVILKDTSDEALKRGVDHIKNNLSKLKYLQETERSFILNRIEATSRDSANIGNANLALEAVFEDLDLKKKILSELAAQMAPDALICTNTSSLSVSKIAEGIERPERVVGMHFFNPVEKMPLIEIIRGDKTSDRTLVIIAALATKMGKFPIIVNDVPGFLVNRILTPYLNEAGFLLKDGYSISDIDRAAVEFGMPMGPIRLLDEVGLDVASHVSRIMLEGYGDRMATAGLVEKLLQKGRKGKKSGAGFYDFADKKETPGTDVPAILGISALKIGRGNPELADRLIMALLNEAVRCLDEGVAGSPGREAANQIDLGTVMGMGFPPFRGGLLFYAEQVGAKAILEKLEKLEQQHGKRFTPWKGIKKRAESGRGFYSAA